MNIDFPKLTKFPAILFLVGFIFFGYTNFAEGATLTWTGATNSSWSNAGNWGGTAPVTGDDLVFPSGASNLSNTNDLTENTIINSITLSGSGYTLSGNPIILGPGLAGITDSVASGGNEIALDIRLNATRDIFVTNTAESLTISGRIAGVGGFNKEGTGTLILSGANTYGGTTKINVGVINARHSTALGTILAGTEVVGGAALELQGNIDISYEALALRGYGVSGTGGALRNISGTNSYGGLITLSSAGGTEIASDSGTLTLKGGTTGNFPLVFDGAGNLAFSTTPIAGSGAITKNGAGTVTLNFPNTNTGAWTINAGTLLYGVDNAIMTGAVTVTGGTLDIATYSDMVGTVTLGTLDLANGTITGSTGVLSSGIFVVYQGTISAIIAGQAGTLGKSTTGTVTLTRPNLFTGATTVTAGILEIQDSTSLGLIDGITTVSTGATLQINGNGLSIPEYITFSGTGHLYTGAIRNKTGNNTLTGLLTLSGASMIESETSTTLTIDTKGLSATTLGLTVGGAGNTTFTSTAPIYGTTATLTKNDSGTLTLQAFNNFTGATNFNGGEVVLSGDGAIPMSTTMTISAGATLTLNNTSSSTVVDRLANSLALTMNGGNFNFIGSSSANMDETVGVLTSGIATQSGNNVITITPGSGGSTTMQFASLTRTAGSSLLFRGTSFGSTPASGVSTLLFTTAPTLTGGSGLENSTTISIIAGAIGDNSLSGTGTDMVTYGRGNSNGLRLLNGAGFSGEYASNFATANANVKLTASTPALTSSINSLILSGSGVITDAGTSQTITLASGNILNTVSSATIDGANTTIAGGSVELQVFAPSDITISSLVTTTGGLTKSGAGTLTFSTAKTYTGLTSINGGTLLYGINNAISSGNLTVNGGILDIATYTDTVGAVILQNGTITGSTGVLTGTSYNFREGTVSAIIAGSVAVTRIATNTALDSVVTVTRDNTYTGTTTITSGILKLGGAGGGTNTPLGIAGAGSETLIASGGALDLNGYTLGTAEAISSLAGTGFGSSGSSNMGAIMNSSASPASYSGALTLTAAARINADYGAMTISGNASGNFALTFGGFSDITYSGVRSGTSTIVKVGMNTLILSNGNSSYSGATTISEGTVKLGAVSVGGTNSPLGTTGGATTITTGSRLDLNGYSLGIAEPLTLSGVGYGLGDFASGAIMNSSASAVTFTGLISLGIASTIKADYGDINLTAAGTISGSGLGLTLGGSGTGTLSSIIGTVAGTVTKIGIGTWTLSGQSTYTGATNVYLGTLKLGANGGATNTPLGTNGAGTTVNTGAVLDFNGFTIPTTEALTINGFGVNDSGAIVGSNGTFGGTIALASESNITNASGTMTITGAVSGAFLLHVEGAGNITTSTAFPTAGTSITKHGSGTFTITGTNLYTGATRVEAGTFAYAASTTLAATPLTVLGGTFNMNATTDTIGAVTLVGGTIQNGTLTATTSYTLESGTISAILAGAIPVTKNTNNTVTLTAANTISSTTTINAGTVVLSGSGSAVSTTITVNLGGTLTLDNTATAVASRLGDALALTMNGGNFNFIGNTAGTSSETTGALTLSSGHNTVTVTPGSGGSTTMTFASFSRTAGATALFRGTNFGSTAGANVSTLIFTAAPTLTGAGGAEGTTTMSILKGAFGDTSLSGTGSDMVTVVSNKLRPLASGEYTGDLQTANANVKLTADRVAVATNTNSLILNGYGITNPGGAVTIPISASGTLAGNILINSATNIAGANTTLGITTNELDILATADSTISATIGTATTGSVVLSGSGNVTLSAANPYTSTTFINDATLTAGASDVISSGGVTVIGGTYNLNDNSDTVGAISLTAGSITTGSGILTGNGSFTTATNANFASTITGNLGLGANATFTIGDGLMDNDAVITAVISGAFTFGKAGAGVLELSGSNTFSGATTISAGTLRLGAAGDATNTPLGTTAGITTVSGTTSVLDLNGYTLGTAEALTLSNASLAAGGLQNTSSTAVTYSGLITLSTGASTIISNYGDINISNAGNITGTFNLTIGGAGNGTLASNLNTSTGTLTKNGVGVWTISGGASTFTGVTTISAGTLKLGSAGSGSNTPFGTSAGGISITSGATFDLNGYTLATAEALAINGTGIGSTGGIGAFINSSNNTISYSGVITPGATSRLANYGSGLLTLTGNIVGSTRAITFVTVGDITQSSGSVWSGTSTSLVKEGSGTLILAGQNSFTTGTVTVSTGVLRLGASGGATNTPLGTSGAGTTVALGAVLDLSTYNLGGASTYETLGLSGTGIKNGGALISSASSGTTYFGATTITANSIVTNSAAGTIRFNSTVTAAASINLWINGSGPTIIGGVYGSASTATLTKDGAGTLTISAVATNTGLVRINGGTLAYGIADALSTSAVTVAGGTLDLAGYSEGGTTLIGAVTLISGSIINTGGAATITSSATYTVESGTISAVLAGTSIALNKNTGGTVTLSAANTFTGLTSINAGTLAWAVNDALSTGSLTITGGTADLGSSTDTVATVTLTSGAITSSTGVLTGTSYAFASGTVSGILAGAVNLAKTTAGTVTMSGANTYSGTTTITAGTLRATSSGGLGDGSGTNTLIFNGGTLQAGGNISSPSGRSITLTSTGLIDTNGYTITLAGTIGSASGLTKNGLGTLTTSGAVTLGAALAVNNGTFDQASSLNMTSGTVTVASSGVWSNVGTGSITLANSVTNSGTITLNSNNGSQCIDGTDSILIRSSVNNTTRAWSGTGTFNMYNLDVDDMTGSGVTVYNSTLSGDTTWTVGTCASFSVAGTANGNNTATVKVAYNGSLQGQTGSISGGTWSISSLDSPSVNDIITVWVDGVTDSNESTAVTKWSSGNITSMVLNTNVLTLGSNQNTSLSATNLGVCDFDTGCADEDIMHSSTGGSLVVDSGGVYTGEVLSTLASNTLTIASASTETISSEKILNAGIITATGTPTITLTGTSGTLFTNTGTFTPATSTVVLSGNGDATINSGLITFNNLTSTGTGIKTLNNNITINDTLTIGASSTFDPTSSYAVTGSGTNTLDVTGTIKIQHSTFDGSFVSFETRNINSGSTVDYALSGSQTVDNALTYDNLTVSGSTVGSWTQQTNSGSRTWYGIASSADGTKLVAGTNNGYIYTSTDSGANWTEQTNSGIHTWYGIASSADGTKLAASASAGYIYTSTDSGANWTEQTNSGVRDWIGIASSADGTKLAAIVNGGYIYTSTNSGANWTQQTASGSRSWNSIASSSDGTKLVAGVDGGYIYTSTDSGANWTQQTASGSRNWYSIASSADGTKLAAINNGGYIYTSTNSGANWTEQTNSGLRNWWGIASSTDGTKIVGVVQDGYIYKSTDSGANWTEQTSLGVESWWSATSSSDGEKLAVSVINSGYIHTYLGSTTVTLGGSTNINDTLTLSSRTLDTSNYNISTGSVSVSGGIFTMGSSTVSLTGTGTVWNYSSGTITAGTSTIKLTDSSASLKTFSGNGGTYNNFWFAPSSGTGTLEILGSNTFAEFKDDGTSAHSIIFTAGTTTTLTTWTVSGTAGQLITINSGDGAGGASTSTHTLSDTTGTNESDYLSVQHSIASGGATWYAGINSTDNNSVATSGSGWVFTAGPRYWVGGTASWDGIAGSKWATSSGGTGGASIPTSATAVYFNGSSGSGTVTISSGNTGVKDLIFTGFVGTLAGTAGLTVSGDLTIASGMTNSYTGDLTFNATSGTKTITSNGKTFGSNIILNGSGGTFTPGDAFNTSGNLTITAGTFALGANNVTIGGTTSVSGTLNDSSATGTNIFTGAVTVNNGGVWSNSNNPAFEFRGGLTVNSTSTFSSGSGTYTFSTNAQSIGGTQSYTITNLTNNISSGNGLTFSTNNPTITTLTQGTNAVLSFSGTVPTITTLTATASPNTVAYTSAGSQSILGVTYHHLTLSGGGTYTAGNNLTVNGQMNVTSGTFDPTSSYTVTGSGTNTLDVTGTLKVQHSAFAGSYISFETVNFNSGSTVDYALNGTQTVDNTPTYYNLTISGGGTKTLGGATTMASSGTLTVSAGTLSPGGYLLTGNGTNTLTVASGATLNVDASTFAGNYSAGFATRNFNSGSTVNYALNGTQTVDNTPTYYNLTISGGGNKTLGGLTNVTNVTTLNAGTLVTGNYAFSTSSVVVSGGSFNMGSSNISLTGTGTVWNYSSGTITAGTSTIKLTDTSATSKTFAGGGQTYGNIWFAGDVGGGSYVLTGSNTFNHFRDNGTSAHSLSFTAGTNTTISSWDVSGSVGNLITLNSTTPLSTWTITNPVSGYAVESDYLSIRDSIATGSAYFFAGGNSVNDTTGGSANTGWVFAIRPRGGGGGVESSATPDPQVGGGSVGGGNGSENGGNGDQTGGGSDTGGGGGDVGFLPIERIIYFINKVIFS